MQSLMLAVLLGLLVCCQGVGAQDVYTAEPWEGAHADLIYDRSPPPVQLQVRDETSPATASSIRSLPTGTDESTSAISTATPTAAGNLPTPFDSSLGNNFTAPSCPTFFRNFMSNETFVNCLPLSLLLQTSNSFFTALQSPVLLAQTMDASCSANFTHCSALMSSLARTIKQPSTCGDDYKLQNPMVRQAYAGFVAYETLYRVGCLTDADGDYCFSNAVSNMTAPTSSYVYYLPLGVQLPAGTRPSCNDCLQDTMQVFAQAAANKSTPLAETYGDAGQMIQMACGPSYAVDAVQRTNAAAAAAMGSPPVGLGVTVLLAMVVSLICL
ncbi:hypothetical protein KC316_g8630 [Hortaea werneckii]|nr:hypothetical protein KC324_g16060 [Hortaea werneckii]KAI7581081.1 hypothetical protein KC316_g8630 [Hortaea werneckii]